MLLGFDRPPKKGDTGPVKAKCLNWTKFRNDRRGQAAPATVKTLPPDWQFVLAEPYFKNLGITAAEAWILVAFLMEAPESTRPTYDEQAKCSANAWKARCKLCTNPNRAVGGQRSCCNWGDCTNQGNYRGVYCGAHFKKVTAIAQAAIAQAEPGVAYDAVAHFALGDARVQADPATKCVPGKVYVAVKDRPTSAGAGSSTDPPPPPPTT
jgi:hypothetical protein